MHLLFCLLLDLDLSAFYLKESEVIIEELQDDELEYTNMPSLVNLPAQIFMSHTEPPFLYQYVGDQVRIIQVLGDDPSVAKIYKKIEKDVGNTLISDKNDTNTETVEQIVTATNLSENTIELPKDPSENTIEPTEKSETVIDKNLFNEMSVLEPVQDVKENNISDNLDKVNDLKEFKLYKEIEKIVEQEMYEPTANLNITGKELVQKPVSLEASLNENNSAESGDDEASFGTPDNSPKTKRKLPKGKYGKGKAPPPPIVDNNILPSMEDSYKDYLENDCDTTSQESLVDILNRMPNTVIKETGTFNKDFKGIQAVNPIAENKRRHKSKSPGNMSKGNITTIGRLLQLPGKFAFWNKTDDTNKSKSDVSEISDHSRRSSINEFQSCADLTKIITLETNVSQSESNDDQISFNDDFFESEAITQDIIDKSDALQKLIEAKIESHPEYKMVAVHAEIPTTSKSTDV
ncbi:Uncharacterized protein OBRU01_08270 [Operophtera brumata]|uniref:Uncharacterized protein n=1 Tax=Operophtera brumata TaxID=104452 RepID=A0A0L7LHL8_OPEBR|nr:Uncharacterized protein OBRU01_08270 [Operophtera brumata]